MRKKKRKKRSYEDWLIVLFKKETFDKKLEDYSLCVHKRTLDNIVILTFRASEVEITKLCIDFELGKWEKLPDERSLLMIIDKEGIVYG